MSHVTYANAVGSLIYVMVYTRSDLSHTIGMLSRYMHDPKKGHWEAVKWILQYIKGTVDVGLVFERNTRGKQLCTGYIDSNTLEILTSAGQQWICVHVVSGTRELVLYFIVYCDIIHNRG